MAGWSDEKSHQAGKVYSKNVIPPRCRGMTFLVRQTGFEPTIRSLEKLLKKREKRAFSMVFRIFGTKK